LSTTSILYKFYRDFDETDPSFTLEQIIQMEMQKFEDQISEVSNKATIELNMENVTIIIIVAV